MQQKYVNKDSEVNTINRC